MSVHAMLFAVLIIIAIGSVRGWFDAAEGFNKKNARLFLLAAFAGNILGSLMTLQEELQPEKDYTVLERQDSGSYQAELSVSINGEKEETVSVQVPEKERSASEQDEFDDWLPESAQAKRERAIQDEVAEYNREKRDPDYYYLPEKIGGEQAVWGRPADRSGYLIAGLFLAGGILIMIFGAREEDQIEMKRQEQMLQDYPSLIMKFTLLVQAGLSVRRAVAKIASDYTAEQRRADKEKGRFQKKKRTTRYAYEEIAAVCNELDSGVSEAEAYRHLGERCRQIRYRTLSTLLVQNLQKGNTSLGDQLERESLDAWEERKRKARVMGEIASTKLLFPMILMLLVVMAVIMIPAFLAF